MLQRLASRAALFRVQVQAPIQQIDKEIQLLALRIAHSPRVSAEADTEVAGGFSEREDTDDILYSYTIVNTHSTNIRKLADGELYLPTQAVLFDAPEVQQIIKMQAGELCFAEDLVVELATALHDRSEHLVVGTSGEEDFASVQLEEGTTNGPDVDGEVIGHAQHYQSQSAADKMNESRAAY